MHEAILLIRHQLLVLHQIDLPLQAPHNVNQRVVVLFILLTVRVQILILYLGWFGLLLTALGHAKVHSTCCVSLHLHCAGNQSHCVGCRCVSSTHDGRRGDTWWCWTASVTMFSSRNALLDSFNNRCADLDLTVLFLK